MTRRDEWQWCRECRCVTNHTTEEHQQAARVMCRECDRVQVHDEDLVCSECLSTMAEYYQPDEGGSN